MKVIESNVDKIICLIYVKWINIYNWKLSLLIVILWVRNIK